MRQTIGFHSSPILITHYSCHETKDCRLASRWPCLLQATLRKIWEPFEHIDLPLVVVVYFALRRDPVQAVIIGTVAGLATER